MHKLLFTIFLLIILVGCKTGTQDSLKKDLDQLAAEYVRLALAIGQYDDAFVDAYYGPDSLKPVNPPSPVFPKDSLLHAVRALKAEVEKHTGTESGSEISNRAGWIADQLQAFDRRIRIFSGEYDSFDVESQDLFGVAAPEFNESYYQLMVHELDSMLPGTGKVSNRFQRLANRFIIPKEKLDTVFKASISECRKRTLEHFQLPENENFELEFVTNKSWNGYNWYQGQYQSLIQINTDLDIFIDRAIDVGSHESYPGHHVYNMLLEKNLYRDKDLVEISVYPLFSPQSLIAEGTANYGIEVVSPGEDKTKFAGEVLLPMAGLDTNGIALYFEALAIKSRLNYVRNDVGRGLLSGAMSKEEAMRWLQEYGLYNEETAEKSIRFIRAYRSYVINYNYGMDLVKRHIESQGGEDPVQRWKIFEKLLNHQVRVKDMVQLN